MFTSSVSESDPDLMDLKTNEDEIECPKCKGDCKHCDTCHHTGYVSNVYKACIFCEAAGKVDSKKCQLCNGKGLCQKEWELCEDCKGKNSTDCKKCSGKGYTVPEGVLDVDPKFQ